MDVGLRLVARGTFWELERLCAEEHFGGFHAHCLVACIARMEVLGTFFSGIFWKQFSVGRCQELIVIDYVDAAWVHLHKASANEFVYFIDDRCAKRPSISNRG